MWFTGINRVVETRVNAIDQREFYAFHQSAAYTGTIKWRVRAVRRVAKPAGLHHPRQLRAVEPDIHSTNPPIAGGVVRPVAAVTALATSTPDKPGRTR